MHQQIDRLYRKSLYIRSFKAIVVRAVRCKCRCDVKKCHRFDRTRVSVNAVAWYIHIPYVERYRLRRRANQSDNERQVTKLNMG